MTQHSHSAFVEGCYRCELSRDEYQAFWDEEVAQGLCPHSGETIVECKASDLCDCFDFPDKEAG